jgi:hypothetical protein
MGGQAARRDSSTSNIAESPCDAGDDNVRSDERCNPFTTMCDTRPGFAVFEASILRAGVSATVTLVTR